MPELACPILLLARGKNKSSVDDFIDRRVSVTVSENVELRRSLPGGEFDGAETSRFDLADAFCLCRSCSVARVLTPEVAREVDGS